MNIVKFQIPKTDQLISVVMGEVAGKMNIVCLCSTSLQFYQLQDNKWCCCYLEKLNFSVSKFVKLLCIFKSDLTR